jgi:hypothetical protein
MRLVDLDAKFLKRDNDRHFCIVETIGDADGVEFLCPKCFVSNNGAVGTHGVICWASSVPQDTDPKPGRWNLSGSSLYDLTFVGPGAVSVLLQGGCNAHFHVRNGSIEDLT